MRKMRGLLQVAVLGLASLCTSTAKPAEQVPGVTDTEILIGTVTDLSGVTAIQGVNNANAIRLMFDEANSKGGINGRKIHYIVEDSQYQVPRAVQAMNKLLNNDRVFMTIQDGGTPMNNATWPMALEKGTPKLLPLTAARSMYEPFNKLKFSQTSSYVDQMRAGVKYFIDSRGKKAICIMYQDTDFGKDVLAGVTLQTEAENLKIVAMTAHKPTDTDFSAAIAKLREAHCDLITLGTIVRDTMIIISTVKKAGWDVDLLGQAASYDTAIATAPGGTGEGFYSMTPTLYAYPDDPRPEIHDLMARYKARYGFELNYIGQTGISVAQIALAALKGAGRDLTVDSLVTSMESLHEFTDIYGNTYSFGPNQHHGSTKAFLAVIKDGRWVPVVQAPLAY
ncbi:ABC transporter substrate-binding protein [Acidisphaera sp. S103]|uniref:ABC transporter substrate-binding protein n=1 Tax=Acidisphaera sp. S103 TaxID=1747223 RepID=UPI00131D6AEC|nr:ABC transporter substrate-binding protein [Acidisphaera sp. S103]